jgi:hypothetical protein
MVFSDLGLTCGSRERMHPTCSPVELKPFPPLIVRGARTYCPANGEIIISHCSGGRCELLHIAAPQGFEGHCSDGQSISPERTSRLLKNSFRP